MRDLRAAFNPSFLLLILYCAAAGMAQMRKGPYLIYPDDPSKMKVLWQLKNTAQCTIKWGLTASYETASATTNETNTGSNGHQHAHTISGLEQGKKYYYRVIENGTNHDGYFYAAPSASQGGFTFYAYGDTRSNRAVHNNVCKSMLNDINSSENRRQTFCLHSGDYVANGDSESEWDDQFFHLTSVERSEFTRRVPVMGCRGNHENKTAYDKVVMRKYLPYNYANATYCWYSFDYGPVHVTVIDDNTAYTSGSTQYEWIVDDLSNTARQWKVVLFHAPAWSAGGVHGNSSSKQTHLHPVFRQHDVAAVINGDNHYYSRAMVHGIPYITSGGGGAGLYDPVSGRDSIVIAIKTNHFMRFQAIGDTLKGKAIRLDGTVIDAFEVVRESVTGLAFRANPLAHENALVRKTSSRSFSILVSSGQAYTVTVRSLSGRIVSSRAGSGPALYDVGRHAFPPGVYVLKVESGAAAFSTHICVAE